MVPEAMAYAGIAGVPALMGLYTVPAPLLLYALFGTSRSLVVGPDSATALISGVTVGALAAGGGDLRLLTSALALLVGLLFLAFGLLRLGWVASFIPAPVMKGFVQGLVWVTIVGQLPKLLGVPGGGGNAWQRLALVVRQLPDLHRPTLLLGLASLALLLVLKRLRPRAPGALIVVVGSIAAVVLLGLEPLGVELVGDIQTGLPPLQLPAATPAQLQAMLPGALAIVLLGYSESLGAAQAAAAAGEEEIRPNQELISLGAANLGSALSSGFVAVGSLSKTSVAREAGVISQVSGLINALVVLLTLQLLMPVFRNLSHATLAAVVIEAMLGLADWAYLHRLRRISRAEQLLALAALLGVLAVGVLPGIALGVVLSLGLLTYRAARPHTAVLGRIPGEQMYRNISRHPEARTTPGLLIFRLDGDLIFPNAGYVRARLQAAIDASPAPVREVLIDAEAINLIDVTAIEMLAKLKRDLSRAGIGLAFARLRDPERERLRRAGLEPLLGAGCFHERITDGVQAFLHRRRHDPGAGPPATAPAGRLGP